MNIGVAIFTLNAKEHLPFCLPPLLNSPLKPKVLVVDSASTDGTGELAKEMGADVLHIPKGSFNHGLTREKARLALGTDIVVMVTQDAYAENKETLEKLIEPIRSQKAALSYGRQLSKSEDIFESFPREFNYPKESHIRSFEDQDLYGSYINFFSDSFGAYSNATLDEIGGFPECLLGEDAIVCAKLLQKGYRVAYVAEAKVFHSHSYTALQEFKRYFDTGLVRAEFAPLLQAGGSDEKRGSKYAYAFLKALKGKSYLLLPKGFLHLGAKFAGYKLGTLARNWPTFLKKSFSSQKYYW